MNRPTRPYRAVLLAALAVPVAAANAQDATTAGTARAPFPTVNNIALEWPVTGDADNDATVAVRYRAQGAMEWKSAMALRRIPAGTNADVGLSWTNRHAGSVFDLQPATTYDVELTLDDPDGGSTQQLLAVTTRAVPAALPGGTVRPVTPATLAAVLAVANPGDILVLAAGTYGGFTIGRDGSAGAPIVLRGTGAVVNGNIDLFDRAHVLLEALTVNGRIRFNGSRHVGVVACVVNTGGDGIVSYTRAENAYIADNTITGATAWAETSLGATGDNVGEGVVVNGPGHVIARNRVRGLRDGISFMEGAGTAVDQFSIDVIDNDISEAADDGVEADFCAHSCRIMRNRLTNTFVALSSQPGLGGPTYFIRNAAYNVVHVPFKLYRGSVGDVVLHNTVVKHGDALNLYAGTPVSRALFRNNLLLGGPGGTFNGYDSGSDRVIDAQTVAADSSLDYNGYGTTLASFTGRLGAVSFQTFAELAALTTETHARQVDLGMFATAVAFPDAPMTEYSAPPLGLAESSSAVDAGEALPNINDGYAGSAPDLGAFERAPTSIFSDGFE